MTQLANIPVKVTLHELSRLSKNTREAFTITPDQLTQIVQEALIKQKEEFESKMELAMRQIRELQTERCKFPRSDKQAGSSCCAIPITPIPNKTNDSGPNVNMVIRTDSPLDNTGGGTITPFNYTGGGPIPISRHHSKKNEDEDEKQKEVESVTTSTRRYHKRKKVEESQSEFIPRFADDQTSQRQPWEQSPQQLLQMQRYSFKDTEVLAILKYLLKNNKIKLPPIKNQEEANRSSDPKYCGYHRRVLHSTEACNILKNTIQALVEAGVPIAGQTE